MMSVSEDDPETKPRLAAFRQALEKLGWSEGRTVRIDTRFAHVNPAKLQALAGELVAQQPDVILATSTGVAAALQHESRTIPIVFVAVSDPIGSGFIANLARPGGNLTGLMLYEDGIVGKWLAMLKEIAPRLSRVALVANPKTTPFDYFLRSAQTFAPSLAIELLPSRVADAADIERTIEALARVPNGGLVVPSDSTTTVHRELIIALTTRHRMPAVYSYSYFVAAGGLMSYGIDLVAAYGQAASYVDRILKGEKPADLPVQAPIRYETAVNLKTAQALGLPVPPALLLAADVVIE